MRYACIYIILFVLAAGCRSSHQRDTSYQEDIDTQETTTIVRTDSTTVETEREENTSSVTQVQEYSRTVDYRDDGSVSRVQEQWRSTGSVQLAQSSGRSSAVSVTREETKTERKELLRIRKTELKKSTSDTRLIQGWEWFFVASGILIVIAIIFYIRSRKMKI